MGTRGFLALAGERSAGVGNLKRARGKGFIASSSLGCGPFGFWPPLGSVSWHSLGKADGYGRNRRWETAL